MTGSLTRDRRKIFLEKFKIKMLVYLGLGDVRASTFENNCYSQARSLRKGITHLDRRWRQPCIFPRRYVRPPRTDQCNCSAASGLQETTSSIYCGYLQAFVIDAIKKKYGGVRLGQRPIRVSRGANNRCCCIEVPQHPDIRDGPRRALPATVYPAGAGLLQD